MEVKALHHIGADVTGFQRLKVTDKVTASASSPRLLQGRGRELFISASLTFSLLIAFNVLIHYTSRFSQRHQFLDFLEHIPSNTDCLFLGNSLVEAGCDAKAFA